VLSAEFLALIQNAKEEYDYLSLERNENYMNNIKTIVTGGIATATKTSGCDECQVSCQSACKTSCTVANQKCENK